MENFNVSGVSGTPNAGASYEVKKQEDAKKMGAIPMTPGGGQSEQVDKPQDFNVYGKDIANFDKFKGNDKNDAMRMTNEAANDVKKAYMQLQHEFPDVELQFEPMPDPTTCGKKREGFFNYQQQLSDWKDMALTQIANERERSTQELVDSAAGTIIDNNNTNAAMNAAVTVATGEAVMKNGDQNAAILQQQMLDLEQQLQEGTAQIIKTVRIEGGSTRVEIKNAKGEIINAVKTAEGHLMSEAQWQGYFTRITNRQEHVATRKALNDATKSIKKEVRENREMLQEEADRIIDTLDPLGLNRAAQSVRDAAAEAGRSVADFIQENPEFLIPGLGVPLGLVAARLFK